MNEPVFSEVMFEQFCTHKLTLFLMKQNELFKEGRKGKEKQYRSTTSKNTKHFGNAIAERKSIVEDVCLHRPLLRQ